ncbi:hypothetical protein ACFQHV_11085 [Promicromonospora thailandica]|uniref:Phosphodiesterase n=1 Tax=Promicromonospora thailandica TaxID=765201 RepID=A0A9X2G800_9MICO|nr:hypothetical protein [Promicromonospora thailandica]MCP2267042.1 hypothetical protein [Promicromonospora thailandica]BFF16678.1 hypothetical protein GCM10025730_01990 [Promicromonospora thailandica]
MPRAVGRVLGAAIGTVRRWRPRPLHPDGVVVGGTLHLEAGTAPGAAALGPPADHPVVVRASRGGGLPAPWPDLFGLAVHWTQDDRAQDLLLSATGTGRVTRFLLAPRRRPLGGAFGTLMPFRDTDGRPVLLAAAPRPRRPGTDLAALAGTELVLLSAHPGGRWHRLGLLRCGPELGTDAPRVDPVLHAPGDLGTYAWAAALRAPAYRAARTGHV